MLKYKHNQGAEAVGRLGFSFGQACGSRYIVHKEYYI